MISKGFFDALDNNMLGKYESHERALEIVDEIYAKIEENTGISLAFAMPQN